jgi:pSer/pThr/pTyr-binding forkhead associated (FHA) protein
MITSHSLETPALIRADAAQRETPIEIPVGWNWVGRSPMAEIRLRDPSVSRRHAVVVRTDDDRLRVIDDRSLTGVFLNGERVRWAELGDGDQLSIGHIRFTIRLPHTSASAAA